ncbi:MAG: ABC transporter ATP-binding protein [Oscillospiraceae bacterium]
MKTIKRLLHLSEQGYKDLKGAVLACVLANLTLLLPFMVLMQAITTLVDPFITGAPLNTGRLWVLFGLGVLAAALYFVAYCNEYDKTYTTAYGECETIRVDVAEKMRRLPLSFFNRKDLSELTTNIMGDCANVEHTMSHLVPSMLANIITISFACLMLALYNWRMSLAIFCTLPVCFGIIFASKKIQAKYGEKHVKAKLRVSDQVQEYLDGIKVVKAFGMEGEKSAALKTAMQDMMREAMRFEAIAGVFVVTAQMLLQLGTGLVILVGVYLLLGGGIGIVPFLTFVMVSVKIYAPITTLMTLLPEFFYLLIATRRMQALREEPVMEGREDVTLPNCNIELNNVTFAYRDTPVLQNVSMQVPQGQVTALVGPSGSGKSTVSRLIARFWDVNDGSITIGGENVREVDPERLMSYMSFVFQDVVLFDDTVYNNIRLGRMDATEEEVYHAAKMARCEEFIQKMPEGYQTRIGENGCEVSGGERQRISIARALLKNAPIVLLDEATASLDPENELQIQQAISELVRGRTVLVIAHRLRTVAGADNIVVLDGGKVAEQGSGPELLRQNGLFAHLYQIQKESLGWTVGA